MATPKEEYFTEMLEHPNEYNDRHSQQFSSKKLQESVFRVMKEEKIESNVNKIKTDTSFQSPVAMNALNKDANMSLERRLASGILSETIKNFKGCTIQSTINNSVTVIKKFWF